MSRSSTPIPAHARWRLAAWGVLVTGLLAAALVYLAAAREPAAPPDSFSIVNGQVVTRTADDDVREWQQIERVSGKAGVVAAKWRHGWESLWQGTRLAWTVASLSLLVALGMWHVAGLMAEPLDEAPDGPDGSAGGVDQRP